MRFLIAIGFALMFTTAGCTDASAPADAALFRVDVGGEWFTVSIADAAVIGEAERRMEDEDGLGIVIGTLARGDGGFNDPWSWHMRPGTVQIADTSIELCDGLPSQVEADLDYWVDTVTQLCPWGGRLAERIR